ncbi:hypothetical protein [Streptomyces tubercidicus]
MRALVLEKRGPVRKLTLWELCHLLPARGEKKGGKPSSISRIRNLLRELAAIGLVTTPEGKKFSTSSRALASGRGVSMRINVMPVKTYKGPRNVFDVLDDVREAAEKSARLARQRELEQAAEKRAKQAEERTGQNSDPGDAGQNSDPLGQNSDPLGQNSDPYSGADLQDREPPHSPPAQTSHPEAVNPPVRPSVQVGDTLPRETDGRTDADGPGDEEADTAADGRGTGGGDDGHRPRHVQSTPGMDVLRAVGNLQPELRLTGKVKTDQARRLNELIAASEVAGDAWTRQQLVDELAVPLTEPIRKTPGAVISGRISLLPLTPHTAAGMLPPQTTGDRCAPPVERERSSSLAADRLVDEAAKRRVRGECPDCGADSPGGDVCPACLGWPQCEDGCGRRVKTGGVCPACQERARLDELAAEETDDGTCPGLEGEPCGRPVVSLGYCWRHRTAVDQARAAADQQWETSVAAAVAAVESHQASHAPF